MTTETTNQYGVSEIELDVSRHIPSMKLANEQGLTRTIGLVIAKAACDEKEVKPKAEEPLSTRDKFFRNLYESTPDDKKPQALLKDFRDKNRVVETLRSVGFKGLEFEQVNTQSARDYNLSLLDR